MERTSTLNAGDEAMTTAIAALARVLAEHMEDGAPFIARLRAVWLDLARQTTEGPVGRNVYIALAQLLPQE